MISGKDRLKALSKIVKENIAKFTDEDYAANNTNGIVTNRKAAYNIKQEAKAQQKKELGLGKDVW